MTGGRTCGSVYGGYTSRTGKTTGNTVRFTGGTVTGTIYGGSDAKDVKENTLVVSGERTARQIANFEKLHFDAGMAKANDTLLTLKGGAATAGLNWQKLEASGLDENRLKTLTSPFTEKLFSLMENATMNTRLTRIRRARQRRKSSSAASSSRTTAMPSMKRATTRPPGADAHSSATPCRGTI